MPILHDELLSFRGLGGTPSRCRVRVFLPPNEARESSYITLLTDDRAAEGTSITNAAEIIAATVCRKWKIPPERTQFVEHYDFRHLPGGHDDLGRAEAFARVEFPQATAAMLARDLMAAADALNLYYGRGTVRPATMGFGQRWQMRRERLSPCYMTRLRDVPMARL